MEFFLLFFKKIFLPKVKIATKKSDSFKIIKINKRKIALSNLKQT